MHHDTEDDRITYHPLLLRRVQQVTDAISKAPRTRIRVPHTVRSIVHPFLPLYVS
jgi:hypothetical protein